MKKTISIVLCICLAAVSFVSCKKDSADNSATIYDSIAYTYDAAYSFDDATIRAYKDLCKTVAMGDVEVRMNPGLFDNVLQLFYTSFPLSVFVENIELSDGVYKITYKNNDSLIKSMDFIEKVHDICSLQGDESDAAYAIRIYNKIASSIKVSENTAISCYETIMTGEGTSFSYSNMFEYLLQQKGIKAYHILCEDMGGNSKAISAAQLDGKLYYFDLFSEYYDNKGAQLKFFGMTTEDAQNAGLQNFIYTNHMAAKDASDLRFQACRFCKEWKIESDELLITRSDGEIVQVALKL